MKITDNKGIRKIQELIYELTIGTVMTRKVITVSPDFLMSRLRYILRDNRISGVPIIDEEKLAGIISMEDLIKWLASGSGDCPVGEKMEKNVICLYEDEPLIHAVSKLEHYGYGRIPVMSRENNRLVGVITKGDVIEGLLKKLEIEYHEEEIHHYRASHFFEDITADRITLVFKYLIREKDIEHGGSIASQVKKNLQRLGIHPNIVRRVAIVIYEAEMNVIIYAEQGKVTVKIEHPSIHIEIKDKGPGIPDIEKAMQPGFSTAPPWVRELGFGAGMGLCNIKNCAGTFHIASAIGRGTVLKININMEP